MSMLGLKTVLFSHGGYGGKFFSRWLPEPKKGK